MSEAKVQITTLSSIGSASQLLAKARYNNVAESQDELSFRQGDIVAVVQKDFNNQVDWWLCELRGKVGMVPANYFEVFHNHDSSSDAEYDIPRPSSKAGARTLSADGQSHAGPVSTQSSVPSPSITSTPPASTEATDCPIYDLPPPTDSEGLDRDYDLPPSENAPGFETYDRPPSSHGSTRSSIKSMNRISTASSVASSTGIYDMPPDLTDVYDFPKSSQPARGFEEEERQGNILQSIDISSLMDDEAEEMLRSYCQVITATYEVLFSAVYGPEAYWGNDYKAKRLTTLKMATTAARHFDKAVLILLQFGKGVVNRLEYVSDMNFRKKYMNAFKGLLHSRNDILGKLEVLGSDTESVTSTVKSLLEIARTVPRAVTEFTVLVQANKSILFKPSTNKSASSLPVITKSEVKVRPLPKLPQPLSHAAADPDIQDGDYAIPAEGEGEESQRIAFTQSAESNLDYNSTLNRRRKPNDILPPLPYATLPRSGGGKTSPGLKNNAPAGQKSPVQKSPVQGGGGSSTKSNTLAHTSPLLARKAQLIDTVGGDYDEIDKTRNRSVVLTSRPSIISLGSNSSRGPSPTHLRIRRGSLSSCSSSDDLSNSTGLRRANSTELLDTTNPYGRPIVRQLSSPQPMKMEEKMILDRFGKQFDLILPGLRDSIDFLLDCLKENEPPRDFVTKSKFTVVAAYKLVYVADALSQKIVHNMTKSSIISSSNELTQSIKDLVSATKTAALQYPSVIALDQMGRSLKQLYPCALDLITSVKTRAN